MAAVPAAVAQLAFSSLATVPAAVVPAATTKVPTATTNHHQNQNHHHQNHHHQNLLLPAPKDTGNALLLHMGLNYAMCKTLLLYEGQPALYQNKDKWACLVSRRQFATEETLQAHVEKSSLYKVRASAVKRIGVFWGVGCRVLG